MANMFSHSLAALKFIKNELNSIKKVINIIVQIVFFLYCLYLIFSNFDSLAYIIIYSLILIFTILTFIIEPFYKSDIYESKAIKRLKRKERKIIVLLLKSLKYLCKMAALIVAIVEISLQGATDLSIISTIVSGIILILQIIFDSIAMLATRYTNMLQLAVEEDIRTSKTIQFVLKFNHKDYLNELNEDRKSYTEDELDLLHKLETLEKDEEEKRRKKLQDTPIDRDLMDKYSSFKEKARSLIANKKDFKSLLKQTEKFKFNEKNPDYKQIPNLLDFLRSYKKKHYPYIKEEHASTVAGTLLYLEDKEKDDDMKKDQIIINKCIKEIDTEYKLFLSSKEERKKHHFFRRKES